MKSVFSIIIPLYNKANTIHTTISSVLSQTFYNFELIVVNDGATDKSREIVQSFTDNRLRILDQENRGASAARNLGIKNAKGTYIAFLDADDSWERDHLEQLLKLCHAFPDAGMYCMGYHRVYAENMRRKATFSGISNKFFGLVPNYFDACGIHSLASSSSVCVAAQVFETTGLFDTQIQSGQDTDMWIRIALQYKVALNNKATANYNIHIRNSLSKSAFAADRIKVLSKFTTQEKDNPPLKKYIDLNRYAMSVACKVSGAPKLRKKALENINYKNLNYKQRLLLKLPAFMLIFLKKFQRFMARQTIVLSAFR